MDGVPGESLTTKLSWSRREIWQILHSKKHLDIQEQISVVSETLLKKQRHLFQIEPHSEEILMQNLYKMKSKLKNAKHNKKFFVEKNKSWLDTIIHITDWIETKKVAQLIYAEFFAQGDLEKKMGREPINMMDREKASIPHHQLVFLKDCCICIFKLLANMFPKGKVLIEAIKQNILCWEAAKLVFDKMCVEGKTSYEVLVCDELQEEVQDILIKLKEEKKSDYY